MLVRGSYLSQRFRVIFISVFPILPWQSGKRYHIIRAKIQNRPAGFHSYRPHATLSVSPDISDTVPPLSRSVPERYRHHVDSSGSPTHPLSYSPVSEAPCTAGTDDGRNHAPVPSGTDHSIAILFILQFLFYRVLQIGMSSFWCPRLSQYFVKVFKDFFCRFQIREFLASFRPFFS